MKKKYIKIGVLLFAFLAFFGGISDVKASCGSGNDSTWKSRVDKGGFDSNSNIYKNSFISELNYNYSAYSGVNGYAGYRLTIYQWDNAEINLLIVKIGGGVYAYSLGWNWYVNGVEDCSHLIKVFEHDVPEAFTRSTHNYPVAVTLGNSGSGLNSWVNAYFSPDSITDAELGGKCSDCTIYYATRIPYYTGLTEYFRNNQSEFNSKAKEYYDTLKGYYSISGVSESDYSPVFNANLNSINKNLNYNSYANYNNSSFNNKSRTDLENLYNLMNSDFAVYEGAFNALSKTSDLFGDANSFAGDVESLAKELGEEKYPLEAENIIQLDGGGGKTAFGSVYGLDENFSLQDNTKMSFKYEYEMMKENKGVELPVTFDGDKINFDYSKTITLKLVNGASSNTKSFMKQTYDEYYKFLKYAVSVKCNNNESYCSDGYTTGFSVFAYKLHLATENTIISPLRKMYEVANYAKIYSDLKGYEDLSNKYEDLMIRIENLIGDATSLSENFAILITEFSKFDFSIKYGDDGKLECSTYISEELSNILSLIYFIAEVGSTVLIVILGSIDFVKATASSDAEALKKSWVRLFKRIIALAIMFLLPLIVKWLLVDLFKIKGIDQSNPVCVNTNQTGGI